MLGDEQSVSSEPPRKPNKRTFPSKVPFTKEEDARLERLVRLFGTVEWGSIAARMPTRNARQCRDRYNNYVNPNLKTGGWTQTEDEQLENLYALHGPQWTLLSQLVGNRSVNALRNRHFELVGDGKAEEEVTSKRTSSLLRILKEEKDKTCVEYE